MKILVTQSGAREQSVIRQIVIEVPKRKHTSTGDREALQDWLDEVDTECNENIDALLGRLWHSTDILPAGYCSQLELPQGSSYATAAQKIAAERKQAGSLPLRD